MVDDGVGVAESQTRLSIESGFALRLYNSHHFLFFRSSQFETDNSLLALQEQWLSAQWHASAYSSQSRSFRPSTFLRKPQHLHQQP